MLCLFEPLLHVCCGEYLQHLWLCGRRSSTRTHCTSDFDEVNDIDNPISIDISGILPCFSKVCGY